MPSKLEYAPSAPQNLSTRAKRLWESFCMEFADKQMLYRVDLEIIAQYCYEMDQYWMAVDHLNREGSTQKMYTKSGDSYDVVSPWIKIKDSHYDNAYKIAIQFGLTPAARTRIAMNPLDGNGTLTALMNSDDDDD
jgi:P27 family predicted phage terminase small subunit